ncbi:MAG: TfoX/Sxy family protein [Deltaproteobacteria bacterium]|nr:TfoX/Sxy family protein [Deltaproteobacteria bacterium]
MAYDEGLAQRVREQFEELDDVVEKKMFGGLCFMVQGNMSLGVNAEDLMVRVGPEGHEEALAQPHARPMDFTKRPMKGFVFVDPKGYEDDAALASWVERSLRFVLTLPAK